MLRCIASQKSIDRHLEPDVIQILLQRIVGVERVSEEAQSVENSNSIVDALSIFTGEDIERMRAPFVFCGIIAECGAPRIQMCVYDRSPHIIRRCAQATPITSLEDVSLQLVCVFQKHRASMHDAVHHVTQWSCALPKHDVEVVGHDRERDQTHSCGAGGVDDFRCDA